MSALPVVFPTRFHSTLPLSELEAAHLISRAVAYGTIPGEIVEDIVAVALSIPGVGGIAFEQTRTAVLSGVSMVSPQDGPHQATVVAEIQSGLKSWGQIRVGVDASEPALAAPLRLVKFLAQQIAATVEKAELQASIAKLERLPALLEKIVERRKAIRRAVAFITHARRIAEREALALLRKHAAQSGRSLHQVAEAIILSDRRRWIAKSSRSQTASRSARPPSDRFGLRGGQAHSLQPRPLRAAR